MKGATEFDKLCHRIYDGDGDGADYLLRNTHIRCRICGFPLYTYYCEEQLILIECKHCHKKALVEARNIRRAAYDTFGSEGEVKCVEKAPTVDAVPVVRCRDCKYYAPEDWDGRTCHAYGGMTHPDDCSFCSCGERRETGHDGRFG